MTSQGTAGFLLAIACACSTAPESGGDLPDTRELSDGTVERRPQELLEDGPLIRELVPDAATDVADGHVHVDSLTDASRELDMEVPLDLVDSEPQEIACQPNCATKQCGPDGCGGQCGQCEQTQLCTVAGQCEALCIPPKGLPEHEWAYVAGGPSFEQVTALAPGPQGSLFVAGRTGSASFDPGAGELLVGQECINANNCGDALLIRLDSTGGIEWALRLGGNGTETVRDLEVQGQFLYAAGSFSSKKIDFGDGPPVNHGLKDLVVLKLTLEGETVWSFAAGSDQDEEATALAVGTDGSVYVTGWFESQIVSFGDIHLGTKDDWCALTDCGDLFLLKLDPAGEPVWASRHGGVSGERSLMLDLMPTGDLLIAGQYGSWEIDFGGEALHLMETICGPMFGCLDLFAARITPEGGHGWSKGLGGDHLDVLTASAMAGDGGVWLSGYYSSSFFDWGGGEPLLNNSGTANFLGLLDAHGTYQHAHHMGAPGTAAAVDHVGNLILVGQLEKASTKFEDCYLVKQGSVDGYLTMVAPTGEHLWSTSISSASTVSPTALATGQTSVYLGGDFTGTGLDLGGPIPASVGATDLFVSSLQLYQE